ncbi:nuclear transport factor 2 family protein [Propylenella binzhouense]|uniref:Nuclear transport factor 2 family protein n=1 Tax=Propylenella binzhouense TaxID=2555902 RepID=A0A964T9S6_9HYPH|nr:nuclear transport factor 2 family protein [Propylenella binzhouense]MYZ50414.1 nuclear transport factor 2 family protein [Propylenella binzhouense]
MVAAARTERVSSARLASHAEGLRGRTARQVIADHLRLRRLGDLESDLARNVGENVVLLTKWGIQRGHAGVRICARALEREVPSASFEYREILVDGPFGYLEWRASTARGGICDGADSYLVRQGRIVAQSIHYTVEKSAGSH